MKKTRGMNDQGWWQEETHGSSSVGCVNTASMVSKLETRHCSDYKKSQASIHVQQSPLFIELGDYIIFNSFCFGWWLSIYLSIYLG
jgi:hypothetical protein